MKIFQENIYAEETFPTSIPSAVSLIRIHPETIISKAKQSAVGFRPSAKDE